MRRYNMYYYSNRLAFDLQPYQYYKHDIVWL